MTAANGPIGLAAGLRVPIGDQHLDEMLMAIVGHAEQRAGTGDFSSAEEAAVRYEQQDRSLYDEVMARSIGDSPIDRQFSLPLLEAVLDHREWRQMTHMFHGLADYADQYRQRDVILYSAAGLIRSEAARSEVAGIVFEPTMVPAINSGRKTVVRMPVEFTRTGKCVPAPYIAGGGEGGTYALLVSLSGLKGEFEVVPSHRLRIAGARMARLEEVTDEEARLEGFEDRVSFLDHWWERHGRYPFEWRVWRYEFELVEL